MDCSIIIPSFNEKENLNELLPKLTPLSDDIIVVEDGDIFNTSKACFQPSVRLVKGNNKGLTDAIILGIRLSRYNRVVVMDGDQSHPTNTIEALASGEIIKVGSRYCRNGKIVGWSRKRFVASRMLCLLSKPLTGLSDSMSGFFAICKNDIPNIDSSKPKIFLEIARKKPNLVEEIPITFTDRVHGKAKFGGFKTGMKVLKQIAEAYISG